MSNSREKVGRFATNSERVDRMNNISEARKQYLLAAIGRKELMKFYKSKEWLALRMQALQRDNNECQECKRRGRYHKAENVHHIKEVKTHPHLSLTLSNLECLCIKCHNEVHDRTSKKQYQPKFMNEERW